MASVFKEPDRPRKPWRVSWYERGRRRTRRFATKREAEAFAGELVRGSAAPTSAGRLTLEAWIERWITEHGPGWEHRTRVDRARYADKWIIPFIGNHRLGEITRPDVRAWRNDIRRHGASPYTADAARRILSAALGAAVDDDILLANPCQGLRALPGANGSRRTPATLVAGFGQWA